MRDPCLFGVDLCVLPAASSRCIVYMDSPIRTAAKNILGLRCVNRVFPSGKNHSLLGLGRIGQKAFRWCADALRRWVRLGNGG